MSILIRASSLAALAAAAILPMSAQPEKVNISKSSFGTTPDGQNVDLYVMTSPRVEIAITTYGARVVRLMVPDRNRKAADVVLGFDDLQGYLQENPYFGAVVGRYGNRIAKGNFKLGGKDYKLAVNNDANSLHGGLKGFDKVVWTATPSTDGEGGHLELTYLSKDGEEGYPGNLTAKVVYTLTRKGDVRLDYTASTDKDTVQNITNHTYFNLAGPGSGDVLKHEVKLYASRFTPVDAGLIPTGELHPVKGTAFDFFTPHAIGARINNADEQLKRGKGYDHNWVLDSNSGKLAHAAEVFEPTSGRVLEVWTTQPGVQFYTGNFLDGTLKGKGGKVYAFRSGLCLETQHFPDSPNHPKFPTTVLTPEHPFRSTTLWKFSAR